MQKLPKIGLPVILLIVVILIFVSKSSINIGYGEAGVLFKTFGGGVVTERPPLGEGFHIISPWNKVYIYNVKQQEFFEGNMQVLSSNGLEISLDDYEIIKKLGDRGYKIDNLEDTYNIIKETLIK